MREELTFGEDRGGAAAFDACEELLSDAARSRDFAASAIRAILGDPGRLDAIARRSYAHELSFDKIMLSPPREDGCVLRLHVWRPTAALDTVDVHNHGRDFCARLLAGTYTHETWAVSPSGEPLSRYRYAVANGRREATLADDGVERLAMVRSDVLRAGDWYRLDARVLHRLLPEPTCLTCSLVVQGPTRFTASAVFSRKPRAPSTGLAKPNLDPGRLRSTLVDVASAIG